MPAALPFPLLFLLGATLGAIVGSFVATAAVRGAAGGSALTGRSACDGCGRRLHAIELVPLLSWMAQRGRCRACGAAIDPLHPIGEVLGAIVGAVALGLAPGAAGVAGALFGWGLLGLALLDLRAFWLPDRGTMPLLALGLAAAAVDPPAIEARGIGALAGFVALEGVRRLYARVRGRAGLGGGDPKLFAAIGAWLGWAALPMVVLGASLTGLAVALAMHLRGRTVDAATRLPFGALLAPAGFAGWVVLHLR